MTRLALMHEKLYLVQNPKVFHKQLVLTGWGFDKTSNYNNLEKKKPISNCLKVFLLGFKKR